MQKTYSRSNTYIHGYGCNDGIVESSIKSPTNNEEYAALPDSYKNSCSRQLKRILDALGLADISGKIAIPYKYPIFTSNFLDVTLEINVGTISKHMKDCNIELDLTDGDIIYHNQSIKDTLTSIASICDPQRFLNIAFTTNKGKYGFGLKAKNESIDFKFVNAYEHEYDELHSWTMELVITYSFKRDKLPGIVSMSAEWVANLVDDLSIKIDNKDIILVASIVCVILVLGPEISALFIGASITEAKISSLIATVFNTIRSII